METRIISSHTSQVVVYIDVCPYSYNMYMCWRLYLKDFAAKKQHIF